MTNSIPEIRDADLLFVIGSNTTEAHPIIAMEMKRAVHNGAKLIVADPRAIWLSEVADIHLQLRPGTDVWLLNAMAHVIVAEGLADEAFIAKHTSGFEAVKATVADYTPEEAERVTGVPAESIREAARLYATTRKAGIYYTLGITEHTHGTDNVYCLANLVLMTGHLGVRSAGMNPLRGQNNVQGANDAGATPIYYPGYQSVTDPEVRAKYEAAWGVPLSPEPGLNLNVMMKELNTEGIKGLFVMGEDIVLSEPNAGKVEHGLNQCEFLVVQDIFPTETMRYADVVLPATCFAEKDGVFTNSDRRVQRVRKAVEPPGEARPDWQILCDLARAAGYPMPHYSGPGEVYAEMAALAPKFAGISHERLEQHPEGLHWPCPDPEHPGTPTLHLDGPMVGIAPFQAVSYRPSAELPDPEYPLVLSTGRTLYHYNSASQTLRDPGTVAKQPENFIEVHRRDARKLGAGNGDRVRVHSRRGEVEAVVVVSPRVRPGCVWMPFHFPDQLTNRLTNDAGDSVTGTGEYKVCAVRLERLSPAPVA
ncbi:MAG: molybdopterin-dependent oxidoreductase [Planctomycetes bacterium]|nr:molybdopterin-dependent oxidoreductase [Planctomycetota bacterium]